MEGSSISLKGSLVCCLFWCLLLSCTHSVPNGPKPEDIYYQPQYAQLFVLAQEGTQKVLYVRAQPDDAWNRHPIKRTSQRVVCLSTTHLAFINALGYGEHVCGLSGGRYVCDTTTQARFAAGLIKEVGYEAALDFETILALHPTVVFAYTIPGQNADYVTRLRKMGLNVIELSEFNEPHPLGKAEYVMAFASFFDAEEGAHEKFDAIASAYTKLVQQVAQTVKEGAAVPQVLMNAPFRDVWYVPSLQSAACLLVHDAGGHLMGARKGTQSSTLSAEQAFTLALKADYWLHPNEYTTLTALRKSDSRFARIPCLEAGRVWNNNLRHSAQGGSDYYESGVLNPHLILADLTAIFHPQLLPNHVFTYYQPLAE